AIPKLRAMLVTTSALTGPRRGHATHISGAGGGCLPPTSTAVPPAASTCGPVPCPSTSTPPTSAGTRRAAQTRRATSWPSASSTTRPLTSGPSRSTTTVFCLSPTRLTERGVPRGGAATERQQWKPAPASLDWHAKQVFSGGGESIHVISRAQRWAGSSVTMFSQQRGRSEEQCYRNLFCLDHEATDPSNTSNCLSIDSHQCLCS